MAKRVSERATRRGGDHGGVRTPHARGASEEALGVGSDEASSISFCMRARWLVSSLTRRCGGPPAHLPSGRGPGYGGASEREIGQPNPVGGGFASGMRSGRPNSLRGKCVEIKLFKKKTERHGTFSLELKDAGSRPRASPAPVAGAPPWSRRPGPHTSDRRCCATCAAVSERG